MGNYCLVLILAACLELIIIPAHAAKYQKRTFEQLLQSSDLIVKATVIADKPCLTGVYHPTCAVNIDKVLSGTLITDRVLVGSPYFQQRNARYTSESLVLFLRHSETAFKSEIAEFDILGRFTEGEFPIVNGIVWIRQVPFQAGEKENYAGEELIVRKMPYNSFEKLINDLKVTPQGEWDKFLPI